MKKIQVILGLALAVLTFIYGFTLLKDALIFNLLVGLVIGYALIRGDFGFAGSVNRAYRFGSTKLMRMLMFLFVISSIGTAVLLYTGLISNQKFWINPINLGLLLGALLFGIGMAFASCCASGVLQVLSTGAVRAVIVVIFFGVGVFVGFPLAKKSWTTETWFSSSSFNGKGVYLPDWFSGAFGGLIGAVIVVLLLALIVVYISIFIEKRIKAKDLYKGIANEDAYKEYINDELPLNPLSKKTYDVVLGNPWSLKTGAVVLAVSFLAILAKTQIGWGISTIFGLWFGKVLTLFGVSQTWIANYTQVPAASFTGVFTNNGTSVQNVAIIVGGLIAGLTMGKFKAKLKVTGKEVIVFALGGFLLGFGTRLSKGCNVGALYSPIATFSLSGWFFLLFMVIGAILGNFVLKRVLK